MDNLNNICLILQGPTINSEELEKNIKWYRKNGINNIVLSSYSNLITDYIRENCEIIENDKIGNIEIKAPSSNTNKIYKIKYYEDEMITPINRIGKQNIPKILPTNINKMIYQNRLIDFNYLNRIFVHILTTRRGIIKANEKFNSCKYYFKLRSDMFIENLDKLFLKWIILINKNIKNNNDIFKSKLIFKKLNKKRGLFKNYKIIKKKYNIDNRYYFCDYLCFGLKEDINKYYFFKKLNIDDRRAESMIFTSYIFENIKNINEKEIYEKYTIEEDFKLFWYKGLQNPKIYKKIL